MARHIVLALGLLSFGCAESYGQLTGYTDVNAFSKAAYNAGCGEDCSGLYQDFADMPLGFLAAGPNPIGAFIVEIPPTWSPTDPRRPRISDETGFPTLLATLGPPVSNREITIRFPSPSVGFLMAADGYGPGSTEIGQLDLVANGQSLNLASFGPNTGYWGIVDASAPFDSVTLRQNSAYTPPAHPPVAIAVHFFFLPISPPPPPARSLYFSAQSPASPNRFDEQANWIDEASLMPPSFPLGPGDGLSFDDRVGANAALDGQGNILVSLRGDIDNRPRLVHVRARDYRLKNAAEPAALWIDANGTEEHGLTVDGMGRLTLSDALTATVTDTVQVAGSGPGELIVEQGASLSVRSLAEERISHLGDLNVDVEGRLIVRSGALVRIEPWGPEAFPGLAVQGRLDVIGVGSRIELLPNGTLGTRQTGDINVSQGAQLHTGQVVLSNGGTLTVGGIGSSLTAGALFINHIGLPSLPSTVVVRDGATLTSGLTDIQPGPGGTGTILLENGASLTTRELEIGWNSAASNAVSRLSVTGPGSVLRISTAFPHLIPFEKIDVGASGGSSTARIELANEGRLQTGRGATTVHATGVISVDGGVLDAQGHIVLSGGRVELLNGTLRGLSIDASAGEFSFSGGTLSFDSFTGSLANQGGVLEGPTPSIQGDYSQSSGGTLRLGLTRNGPDSNDDLTISNVAQLDGTLNVYSYPEYVPTVGDEFVLIEFASHIGMFSTVNLPTLPGGLAWSLQYDEREVVLNVTGLPGDIDLDGDADRKDAAMFSQFYGTSTGSKWVTGDFDGNGATTLADWALLQSNIGTTRTFPVAAVPEPPGLSLFVLGLLPLLYWIRSSMAS